MNDKNDIFWDLVDIALAAVKDITIRDSINRVEEAYRDFLIQDAESRRKKSSALIMSMYKIDSELYLLEKTVSEMKSELSEEALESINKLIEHMKNKRKGLVLEKNHISHSTSCDTKRIETKNNYFDIPLYSGDILAVTRKGGVYQHYAVYIGDNRVIHYAADKGDFSGRITIHEASFSEFRAGALLVYVLDFPEYPGKPSVRGGQDFINGEESVIFSFLRSQGYHLYSPEETVDRAKSRLGEEKYKLPFNNCEHFALWCKTGVSESHQFNVLVSKLIKTATRKIV